MTRPTGIGLTLIGSGLVLDAALHYIWKFDYVFVAVGIFGMWLFPVGVSLLLGSLVGWLQGRLEGIFFIQLSLPKTTPILQTKQFRPEFSHQPLGKPITTLPHFGLLASLILIFGAVLPICILTSALQPISQGIQLSFTLKNALKALASEPIPIVLQIKNMGPDAKPAIYLNSSSLAWDELPAALKKQLSTRAEWVVYVQGDEDLPFQDVATAMDFVRQAQAKVILVTPTIEKFIPQRQLTVEPKRRTRASNH